MPVLDFAAPDGTTISVLVPLAAPDKERHVQIGEDGRVYKRVYAAPLAARDTRKGDLSKGDFRRMTEGKNLKNGELWEISKEMSLDREEKNGKDTVKDQFYRNYQREFGVRHHEDVKEEKRRKAQRAQEEAVVKLRKAFG